MDIFSLEFFKLNLFALLLLKYDLVHDVGTICMAYVNCFTSSGILFWNMSDLGETAKSLVTLFPGIIRNSKIFSVRCC